jgi:hypothetical protein
MNNKLNFLICIFSFTIALSSCTKKALWQPLFNGENLSNFNVLNGNAEYKIENNTIVGISKLNTPNTFLATKKKYGDFILEFEVWADTSVNSGVQFRSISDPDIQKGRVHGYQAEIESSSRKWAGGIYDEARRGWLYPLTNNTKGQQAFKINEWNKYRIEAIGSEIKTWVNGIQCANLIDNMTSEGIIGLQVHSISKARQEGKLIKWKNLKILTKNVEKHRWESSSHAPIINTNNKGL